VWLWFSGDFNMNEVLAGENIQRLLNGAFFVIAGVAVIAALWEVAYHLFFNKEE